MSINLLIVSGPCPAKNFVPAAPNLESNALAALANCAGLGKYISFANCVATTGSTNVASPAIGFFNIFLTRLVIGNSLPLESVAYFLPIDL